MRHSWSVRLRTQGHTHFNTRTHPLQHKDTPTSTQGHTHLDTGTHPLEHSRAALARSRDNLGGVDLLEALRQQAGLEQLCSRGGR